MNYEAFEKKFLKKLSKDKAMLKRFVKAFECRGRKISELILLNASLNKRLGDADEIIAILNTCYERAENRLMAYKQAYGDLPQANNSQENTQINPSDDNKE